MRKMVLMLFAVALATGSALPNVFADDGGFACKAYDCIPVEGHSNLYWCCELQPTPTPSGECEPIPDTCSYISTE